ncbi:McrC family protein [Psychrobacter sp. I-STPA10]|uniref:McrC family protein n=1 Tax=Psychrobacter sp. I-STPA10 TaxID=2585769 RepID=UPI001E29FD94|nr:McrC family protein [Psychrobacter sp. I-STPA10]
MIQFVMIQGIIKSSSQLQTFTCFEHQRLGRDSFVDTTDFDYLLKQQLPCFDIRFFAGEPQLVARHYLATIWLPSGQRLEILPKITPYHAIEASPPNDVTIEKIAINETRRWVAQMLSQIAGKVALQPLVASAQVGHPQNKPWLDVQQPWYLQLYQRLLEHIDAVAQFLPHHYQQQTQNSPQARGKINFKQQLKQNLHRPHYFVTQKDHWQTHTLLWQFLLTAEQQAQQMLGLSITDKQQIYSRMGGMRQPNSGAYHQHIQMISHRIDILPQTQWQATYDSLLRNKQHWLSQCSRYQQHQLLEAIEWAWWFLQPIAVQPQPSFKETVLPCQAFMLNMQHAFEQWVSVCLAEQIHVASVFVDKDSKPELCIQPSYDWLSIKDPQTAPISQLLNRRIQPDICLLQHQDKQTNRATCSYISHVMDIKYKYLPRISAIASSDLYQLQVYQSHLQARHAWLIYPAHNHFYQPVTLTSSDNRHADMHSMTIVPFCTTSARLLIDAATLSC